MVVFARVVETLSFTEAALSLGMSKSSVSRDISTLEKRIVLIVAQPQLRNLYFPGGALKQHCTNTFFQR